MKISKWISALGVIAVLMPTVPTFAASTDANAMYRLYNSSTGEHFYTANETERNNLITAGWKYESIGWYAPVSSDTPVYRLYNGNAGDHFYTESTTEKDHLVSLGWTYEGIGWYSADNTQQAVYREYNPNVQVGSHNYTTSKTEDTNLGNSGWSTEGISWYGLSGDVNATNTSVAVASMTGTTVYNGVDYKDVYNYAYYTANNADVVASVGSDDTKVLAHFVNSGMAEGRQGSEEFKLEYYQLNYPDLDLKYQTNNKLYYMDYINEGKAAGRVANSLTALGQQLEKSAEFNGYTAQQQGMQYAMTESIPKYQP